jgi:predicted deacylase
MLRPFRTALALAAGFLSLAAYAQGQEFTVGTATAAPGQKATGYLEVPAGSDPALSIPVVVVHGAQPGPTLALVAGAHGTEYASIIALEKLIPMLDPAKLAGTVIVVPLVNVNSFEGKVPHLNPVDGKNMNRFYPGDPRGTQTERASWVITKQVVERADYLIDMHGGDLDENLRPYSYWLKSGNEKLDTVSKAMNLAFGLPYIIITTGRNLDPAHSRYLDVNAASRGKPAITVEAGYAGTVKSEDVRALVHGVFGVMRYLKMMAGVVHPVEHPVWFERVVTPASEATGVFYPLVKKNTYVVAGTELGYVTDFFGKKIFTARAQVSGIVLYVCAVPSMKKGGTIADIGVVAARAP